MLDFTSQWQYILFGCVAVLMVLMYILELKIRRFNECNLIRVTKEVNSVAVDKKGRYYIIHYPDWWIMYEVFSDAQGTFLIEISDRITGDLLAGLKNRNRPTNRRWVEATEMPPILN